MSKRNTYWLVVIAFALAGATAMEVLTPPSNWSGGFLAFVGVAIGAVVGKLAYHAFSKS